MLSIHRSITNDEFAKFTGELPVKSLLLPDLERRAELLETTSQRRSYTPRLPCCGRQLDSVQAWLSSVIRYLRMPWC